MLKPLKLTHKDNIRRKINDYATALIEQCSNPNEWLLLVRKDSVEYLAIPPEGGRWPEFSIEAGGRIMGLPVEVVDNRTDDEEIDINNQILSMKMQGTTPEAIAKLLDMSIQQTVLRLRAATHYAAGKIITRTRRELKERLNPLNPDAHLTK